MHYVYVMGGVGGLAPSKVGVTNNYRARLEQLQTGFPGKLTLHGLFALEDRDDCYILEGYVHQALEHIGERVGGEWFDCSADHACWTVVEHYSDMAREQMHIPRFANSDRICHFGWGIEDSSGATEGLI